jgi:histidine triad (HIT) family protein
MSGDDLLTLRSAAMPEAYEDTNIFAKILRGELPCHKIFEDDVSFAFMDIMPRTKGHCLVVPKTPARNVLDIPAEPLSKVILSVQKLARAAKTAMQADGVTLHQYNEPAGGQVIFHLHFHILPRWTGIALPPHTGVVEKPEVLEANCTLIKAALA